MSVARALDTDREEGIDRRRCLFALLPVPAAFAPGMARAGAQLEEPLMDAVRKAMSDSVGSTAPLEPVFPDTAAKTCACVLS